MRENVIVVIIGLAFLAKVILLPPMSKLHSNKILMSCRAKLAFLVKVILLPPMSKLHANNPHELQSKEHVHSHSY
jgi:hypothetical protein